MRYGKILCRIWSFIARAMIGQRNLEALRNEKTGVTKSGPNIQQKYRNFYAKPRREPNTGHNERYSDYAHTLLLIKPSLRSYIILVGPG